jgi:hypothetical protein
MDNKTEPVNWIYAYKYVQGLSIAQLAKLFHVSVTHAKCMIMSGHWRRYPGVRLAIRINRITGIPVGKLLGIEEDQQ